MNHQASGHRRPRRAAALAAALTGIAVLLTACSGTGASSSAAPESKTYQQALAFVQCMRAHGEPDFPDPTGQGTISDSQLDVGDPSVSAAYDACRSQLPAGDQIQLSPAQLHQLLGLVLRHAQCMRAHGIPNFPDPTVQDGAIHTSLAAAGVDPDTPFFASAQQACRQLSVRFRGWR